MAVLHHLSAWLSKAAREHWLPLLILVAPITLVAALWDAQSNWFLLVVTLPLVAAIVGFALRPRHIWLVWLGGVVLLWIALGAWGQYSDLGPNESVTSPMFDAFMWMGGGMALPLWLGRLLRGFLGGARGHVPSSS